MFLSEFESPRIKYSELDVSYSLPETLMSACLTDVNNSQWNKLKIYSETCQGYKIKRGKLLRNRSKQSETLKSECVKNIAVKPLL